MPRPIPENPELIDGWRYYLIALPDDDVAIAAGWDAFSALANYWEWGLEGPETDSDVMAQKWADAMYETMRIRDMGFPDAILDHIDEVEDLLRALADTACCDSIPGSGDVIGETEGDISESDTDVGGEVFPPGIDNETEWRSYICNAATALVDRLIALPARAASVASWTVAAVTALYVWYAAGAFIAIAGITAITVGQLFGWLSEIEALIAAIQGETEPGPSTIESELNAARDDLICAIVSANDAASAGSALRAAIADAVTSTAWTNILFLFTGNGTMASVFNADNQDAPAATCPSCQVTGEIQGFALRCTQWYIGGAPNGNETIGMRDNGNDTDALYWLTSPSDRFLNAGIAQDHGQDALVAVGNAAALSNIVADNEELESGRVIEDTIRLALRIANETGASQDLDIVITDWQLYSVDDAAWYDAQISIISQPGGWAVDGNTLTIDLPSLAPLSNSVAVVELTFS